MAASAPRRGRGSRVTLDAWLVGLGLVAGVDAFLATVERSKSDFGEED